MKRSPQYDFLAVVSASALALAATLIGCAGPTSPGTTPPETPASDWNISTLESQFTSGLYHMYDISLLPLANDSLLIDGHTGKRYLYDGTSAAETTAYASADAVLAADGTLYSFNGSSATKGDLDGTPYAQGFYAYSSEERKQISYGLDSSNSIHAITAQYAPLDPDDVPSITYYQIADSGAVSQANLTGSWFEVFAQDIRVSLAMSANEPYVLALEFIDGTNSENHDADDHAVIKIIKPDLSGGTTVFQSPTLIGPEIPTYLTKLAIDSNGGACFFYKSNGIWHLVRGPLASPTDTALPGTSVRGDDYIKDFVLEGTATIHAACTAYDDNIVKYRKFTGTILADESVVADFDGNPSIALCGGKPCIAFTFGSQSVGGVVMDTFDIRLAVHK